MVFSRLERYTIGDDGRAKTSVDHLAQLRQAMIAAKHRYEDMDCNIKAEDHELAAVARDVIVAHASYTRYRAAFA